jgi:hypothetical protein
LFIYLKNEKLILKENIIINIMFKILNNDSLKWLSEQEDHSINNFLTGLPDLDEIINIEDKDKVDKVFTLDDYRKFFCQTGDLIFKKLKKNGYSIFIQTDRKINGEWFDKSYHLTNTAYNNGLKLMWHKIVLQRGIGKIHLQRPTYSHVLCYSYMNKPKKCFPDVFDIGEKMYENSTPKNVSDACAEFLFSKDKDSASTFPFVVDPFVGRGTTAVSVLEKNMTFLGIDILKEQCDLTMDLLNKKFPVSNN